MVFSRNFALDDKLLSSQEEETGRNGKNDDERSFSLKAGCSFVFCHVCSAIHKFISIDHISLALRGFLFWHSTMCYTSNAKS